MDSGQFKWKRETKQQNACNKFWNEQQYYLNEYKVFQKYFVLTWGKVFNEWKIVIL